MTYDQYKLASPPDNELVSNCCGACTNNELLITSETCPKCLEHCVYVTEAEREQDKRDSAAEAKYELNNDK